MGGACSITNSDIAEGLHHNLRQMLLQIFTVYPVCLLMTAEVFHCIWKVHSQWCDSSNINTIIQGAYSSICILNSDLILKGWSSHIVKLTLWGCGNTECGLATGSAACCVGGGAVIKTSILFQHLSNEQCACHIWHIKPCSTSVQSSRVFEPGDLWPWQRPLYSAHEDCHLSCWDFKVFRHFHDVSNNCNAYKSEISCSLIGLSLSNVFYMKHTHLYTWLKSIKGVYSDLTV